MLFKIVNCLPNTDWLSCLCVFRDGFRHRLKWIARIVKVLLVDCACFFNDSFLTAIRSCNCAPKSLKIVLTQSIVFVFAGCGPRRQHVRRTTVRCRQRNHASSFGSSTPLLGDHLLLKTHHFLMILCSFVCVCAKIILLHSRSLLISHLLTNQHSPTPLRHPNTTINWCDSNSNAVFCIVCIVAEIGQKQRH